MDHADSLAVPGVTWGADLLEDISLRRLVLEYYDRESIPLQRYVRSLGLDPDTTQEILQESFLKLHQHLLDGGDQSNLRAWLYRVAHNLARNVQTSFGARKTDALADNLPAMTTVSGSPSVEEDSINDQRLVRLRQAMDELSAAQRECLVLRTQGLKYREIAGVLNLSVSTVGENIQRGLERLKELL